MHRPAMLVAPRPATQAHVGVCVHRDHGFDTTDTRVRGPGNGACPFRGVR